MKTCQVDAEGPNLKGGGRRCGGTVSLGFENSKFVSIELQKLTGST